MEGWYFVNKITLGNIADIITGPFGSQLHKSDYVDDGYPLIMPQNICDRTIDFENISRISDEDAIRLKRYEAEENDIIYARRGDVEKHAFVVKEYGKVFCGTGCLRVRVKRKVANPLFVSFYLNRPECRQWISKHAVGSNMPNINTDILSAVPLKLPSLDEQQRISMMLNKLDEKILNSNNINDNLEQQLKSKYDYWFTQFDFPNSDGNPYASTGGKMVYNSKINTNIPANWNVMLTKELLSVVTGKEDANYSTKNGKYKFFTCSNETLQCDDFAFDGNAVLIAGNGDFNVKHYSGKFNAYQRTYVLIPENEKYYAAIYVKSSAMISNFKAGSNGSIVKFITKGDVENIPIIIPDDDTLLIELNQIVRLIEHNQFEIENLIRLRDWLLPMLMNGQATIEG